MKMATIFFRAGRRDLGADRRSGERIGPHRQHRAFSARDEPGAAPPQCPAACLCGGEPAESAALSGQPPGSHKIEGIGLGFLLPLWHPEEVTEILTVSTEDAKAMARYLAREEAIFAGTSTGAKFVAADCGAIGNGQDSGEADRRFLPALPLHSCVLQPGIGNSFT